jgi:DNA repair exonuclease SbcCD nuclease subunit
MTRPSARFLHAAGVRLDVPVEGFGRFANGSHAAKLREVLSQSSFRALERLVAASTEHDVDFVLLGGETFRDSDASVAARGALRRAFEQWTEHSIPVFVVPGAGDPAEAWTAFPSLPENVTLLTPDPSGDGPHHVERGEEGVVALEYWHQSPQTRRRSSRESGSAWRIAVLADSPWQDEASLAAFNDAAADYFAVAPVADRRTEALKGAVMHSPGATTPTGLVETSAGDATLVSLDEERGIECEPLGLSSFGRLSLTLLIDDRTTVERLVQEMKQALREVTTAAPREAMLVSWGIRGNGPLRPSLSDPEFQQLVLETAADGLQRTSVSVYQHLELEPLLSQHATSSASAARHPLAAKAFAALEDRTTEPIPQEWLRQAGFPGARLTRSPDRARVNAAAAALLGEWLTGTTDE